MASTRDKRLRDKEFLWGQISQEELAKEREDLPDLAANVAERTEDELSELREALQRESALRAERIERFLSEPRVPEPPPAPIVPIDQEGPEV